MKIAELTLLENITKTEFISLLNDPTQKIEVAFRDRLGKEVLYNVAPHFRSELAIAVVFKKVFDFADYQLNKDDVMLSIMPNGNTFKISASQLTDADEGPTPISKHELIIELTTNTGNVTGAILASTVLVIDVGNAITKQQKDNLKKVNLELTGVKWNEFTIKGKANIVFKKSKDNTVFVGNKLNGFLLTV